MRDLMMAVKLATRRLVEKAGGIVAAEAATGYSKSSLSNSYRLDHDCTMPVHHVLALEDFVGRPVVTREMARVQGYDLVPTAGQHPKADNFDTLLLRATKELGEAVSELAGRQRFESLAVFQKAEREALEAREAAQHVLDEVRRYDPRQCGALRPALHAVGGK